VTIAAQVILFAIDALHRRGPAGMRAFSSRTAGPVVGRRLLALIDLAASGGETAGTCCTS